MFHNSPVPQQAMSVAREALAGSDAMRGLGAMNPPNTGMVQAQDGGAYSKLNANGQIAENQFLAVQNKMQNQQTAVPQAIVGAERAAETAMDEKQQANFKAQQLMNSYAVNELEKRGGAPALMQMAAIMQSPAKEQMINDVATTRAMFSGMAPELGAYAAQTQQYA